MLVTNGNSQLTETVKFTALRRSFVVVLVHNLSSPVSYLFFFVCNLVDRLRVFLLAALFQDIFCRFLFAFMPLSPLFC